MPTLPASINGQVNQTKFWLEHNTQVFTSPLSRAEQRLALTGARWRAFFEWTFLTETAGLELLAFLDARDGPAETFEIFNPVQRSVKGTATAGGLVNGASQTGGSLITDTWAINQTGLFKAGDLFQVGTELHRITQDINSDGVGAATLVFKPNLRTSPANNATIVISDAKVLVRLADIGQGSPNIAAPTIYSFALDLIEAF